MRELEFCTFMKQLNTTNSFTFQDTNNAHGTLYKVSIGSLARRRAYLHVFQEVVRVFTLRYDGDALLNMVSQQHLREHSFILFYSRRDVRWHLVNNLCWPARDFVCASWQFLQLQGPPGAGVGRCLYSTLNTKSKKTKGKKAGGYQGCTIPTLLFWTASR